MMRPPRTGLTERLVMGTSRLAVSAFLCILVTSGGSSPAEAQDAIVLGRERGPERTDFCVTYEISRELSATQNSLLAGYRLGERLPREEAEEIFEQNQRIVAGACGSQVLTYTPMVGQQVNGYSVIQGKSFKFSPAPEGEWDDCGELGDLRSGRCSTYVTQFNLVPAIVNVKGTDRIVFVQTELTIVDPVTGRIYGRAE